MRICLLHVANLPFFVNRSRTGNLPVYTDYKNGRKTVLTQIRKIDGDIMVSHIMYRDYSIAFSMSPVYCMTLDGFSPSINGPFSMVLYEGNIIVGTA